MDLTIKSSSNLSSRKDLTNMTKCDTIKTGNDYNVNKRQIYVWVENKEFFDKLPNKSKFINLLIKQYRQRVEDTEQE